MGQDAAAAADDDDDDDDDKWAMTTGNSTNINKSFYWNPLSFVFWQGGVSPLRWIEARREIVGAILFCLPSASIRKDTPRLPQSVRRWTMNIAGRSERF